MFGVTYIGPSWNFTCVSSLGNLEILLHICVLLLLVLMQTYHYGFSFMCHNSSLLLRDILGRLLKSRPHDLQRTGIVSVVAAGRPSAQQNKGLRLLFVLRAHVCVNCNLVFSYAPSHGSQKLLLTAAAQKAWTSGSCQQLLCFVSCIIV